MIAAIDIGSALVTSALTILGGVLLFGMGQVLTRFYLDPLERLRQLIGKIAFSMDYYANQLFGGQKGDKARTAFRRQACQLREMSQALPNYDFFAKYLKLVPDKRNVEKASSLLICLSNTPEKQDGVAQPSQDMKQIQVLLGLKSF